GDEVTKELVEKLSLPGEYGAHVIDIAEGSAAEKAGLQKEDVIVGYNGSRVESMAQLRRMVGETPVGRTVALKVIRNGVEQEVRAELATRTPSDFPSMEFDQNYFNLDSIYHFDFDVEGDESWIQKFPEDARERLNEQMEKLELHLEKMPDLGDVQWESFGEGDKGPRVFTRMLMNDGVKLGVTVQTLTPQLGKYFKLDEGQKGVLISEVHEGFPAAKADIKAGDVIVNIEGEEVGGPLDIMRIISTKEGVVQVNIIRNGNSQTIPVDLGSRDKVDSEENQFFFVPKTDEKMLLRNK
ncbi:MAG: PDZ domain-containing protein, partial [Candidatus Kapaibacterium sp.]